MALVLYKCDVCKREITIPRNPKGLEVIGRCNITLGCRGKLYQEELLEDFTRGEIPADVAGLDNYQQRRVLYNHLQQQKKTSWTITHGLGTFPVISTFIDSPSQDDANRRIEVTPVDVVAIDDDTVRVTFDGNVSGIAQLVARATDPQLFNPVSTVVDTTAEFRQLTNSSEMSIATTTTVGDMRVFFNYITTTGITVPINVVVSDTPSIISPWVTSNRVLIQGKIFTVRSFNPIALAIASNQVPDLSRVVFAGVQPNTNIPVPVALGANQIYMLLADSPFEAPDRIFEKVVDAVDVSTASSTKSLVLSGKEILISETAVKSIHPPIRSL